MCVGLVTTSSRFFGSWVLHCQRHNGLAIGFTLPASYPILTIDWMFYAVSASDPILAVREYRSKGVSETYNSTPGLHKFLIETI